MEIIKKTLRYNRLEKNGLDGMMEYNEHTEEVGLSRFFLNQKTQSIIDILIIYRAPLLFSVNTICELVSGKHAGLLFHIVRSIISAPKFHLSYKIYEEFFKNTVHDDNIQEFIEFLNANKFKTRFTFAYKCYMQLRDDECDAQLVILTQDIPKIIKAVVELEVLSSTQKERLIFLNHMYSVANYVYLLYSKYYSHFCATFVTALISDKTWAKPLLGIFRIEEGLIVKAFYSDSVISEDGFLALNFAEYGCRKALFMTYAAYEYVVEFVDVAVDAFDFIVRGNTPVFTCTYEELLKLYIKIYRNCELKYKI